jgi:light-regulated signal transduction histidine kinase (bacteriophytochrome)
MRVLIAEDEMLSRRMLTRDLQKLGFEVDAAENGRDAWEKFQRHASPIVVTDWNMPEMNGIDLVKCIRGLEKEEYVYVILLTARNEKTDLIEGMEAGADDFIVKPFELEELRVRLRAGERMLEIQQATARQKKELEVWKAKAEKMTAELKRSNAELDQFAYAAWHDMRAPLRTQQTRIESLVQRWKGQLDAAAEGDIARVLNSVATMYEILDALYEHSQVGGQEGNIAPIDCSRVVNQAITNLQGEITASGSEITMDPLPTVSAVETEVMRLFQNLIGNAIKYRESRKSVKVHVACRREGNYWLFSVKDDGIGFEPDKRELIFETGVGSRLHSTKKYPGTGFGLSFCKKVAERHGGRIWAESEVGKGSTFFFTIPADLPKE